MSTHVRYKGKNNHVHDTSSKHDIGGIKSDCFMCNITIAKDTMSYVMRWGL